MLPIIEDMLSYLSQRLGHTRTLYVSGKCLVTEYTENAREYLDMTLHVEPATDLTTHINQYFYDCNYVVSTVRPVTDNIIVYILDGWSVTINTDRIDTSKYCQYNIPNVSIITTAALIADLLHSAKQSALLYDNMADVAKMLCLLTIRGSSYIPYEGRIYTFYTDVYSLLGSEDFLNIAANLNTEPEYIQILFDAFLQPFVYGNIRKCEAWNPATQEWMVI